MRTFNLLVAAFALLQLLRHGRRGLRFLLPAVRVSGEAGVPPPSARRLRLGAELEGLGFAGLGVLRERAALGLSAVEADVYASAGHRAYADVLEEGGGPRVRFVTPFADGATVLTAAYARPAVESAAALAAGMPDAPLTAVLAAHEVAVRRFAEGHGAPRVSLDLEARLGAARAWHDGAGRRELRRGTGLSFGAAALALLLLASSLHALLAR